MAYNIGSPVQPLLVCPTELLAGVSLRHPLNDDISRRPHYVILSDRTQVLRAHSSWHYVLIYRSRPSKLPRVHQPCNSVLTVSGNSVLAYLRTP